MGVVSVVKCDVLSIQISLFVYWEDLENIFKILVKFILDYVSLAPLILIHIIPEESQYVVDVMRRMHKKEITDDILTLLQLLCLILDLDHSDYRVQTSTKDGRPY